MNNTTTSSGFSTPLLSKIESSVSASNYATANQPNQFVPISAFQSFSSNSNLRHNSATWAISDSNMSFQLAQQPQNLDFVFGRNPHAALDPKRESQSSYLLPENPPYLTQPTKARLSRQNSAIQPNSPSFPPNFLLPQQQQQKVISRKPSFAIEEIDSDPRGQLPGQRWNNFVSLQPLQIDSPQELLIPRSIQMSTSNRSIKSPAFSTQNFDSLGKQEAGYPRPTQEDKKSYIELQNNNYEPQNYVQFANLSNSVIYNQNKPRNTPENRPAPYFSRNQYQTPLGLTQGQFNPASNLAFQPLEQPQLNVYGLPTPRPAPNPEMHLVGVSNLIEKLHDNGKLSARVARSPEPRQRAETAPLGQAIGQINGNYAGYIQIGHQANFVNQIPQPQPQYSFPHR